MLLFAAVIGRADVPGVARWVWISVSLRLGVSDYSYFIISFISLLLRYFIYNSPLSRPIGCLLSRRVGCRACHGIQRHVISTLLPATLPAV